MTYEEALAKAVKCLKLSQSSNPAESALAASKAQEIIDRYNIDQAAIALAENGEAKPDEPIKDFGSDPLERMQRKSTWKGRLASVIARHNSCKMYNNYNGPAVVGRPSDVQTVRYFYAWLTQEVDRLAARDCKGNGLTWANEYRNGVVDTIAEKLREQAEATKKAMREEVQQLAEQTGQSVSLALVRINNAIAKAEQRRTEVEQWTKANMNLRAGRASYSRSDPGARSAGRIAGREIRMQPAKGQLS